MTTVRRSIAEIAKKATKSGLKQGYLAEDYDGIGSTIQVRMSRGSSSAVQASIAAGSFATEQVIPEGTPVYILETNGRLEVTSLGSKLAEGSLTTEMVSQSFEINDSSGEPVLTVDKFVGAWDDFIANGLYNSNFHLGIPGILEDGASIPYWELSRFGVPVVELAADTTMPGGQTVHFEPSAAFERAYLLSDPISVQGGFEYATSFLATAKSISGSVYLMLDTNVRWYKVDGTPSGINPISGGVSRNFELADVGITKLAGSSSAFAAPTDARFGRVELMFYCGLNYSGTPDLEVAVVRIERVPAAMASSAIPPNMVVALPFIALNIAATASVDLKFSDTSISNAGRVPMAFAGKVIALSVRSTSARTAGYADATLTINGVPQAGMSASLTNVDTLESAVGSYFNGDPFGNGISYPTSNLGRLGVQLDTVGWGPVGADVYVILWVAIAAAT